MWKVCSQCSMLVASALCAAHERQERAFGTAAAHSVRGVKDQGKTRVAAPCVIKLADALVCTGRCCLQDGEWATPRVHAYNIKADAWSELPPLPFPICHASPVVVRVPSVLY